MLHILTDPRDRKDPWIRDFVNESLSGRRATVTELSEQVCTERDVARATRLLKEERDRLGSLLTPGDVVLAPGKLSSKLALSKVQVEKVCGTLEDSYAWPGVKTVVTFPFHELRDGANPALRGAVQRHLFKASAWADGRAPKFEWPRTVTLEGDGEAAVLAALYDLHTGPNKHIGCDVETPKIKDTTFFEQARQLLNVGFGSGGLAVSITWPAASWHVKDRVCALLRDGSKIKVMHNGSFDAAVFAANAMELRGWRADTMETWRFLHPGLPKSLRFVAAFLTWCPDWKDEFKATKKTAEGDLFADSNALDRAVYNARDSWLQWLCWEQLKPFVDRRNRGWEQVENLHDCLQIGVRMFCHGIPVSKEGVEEQRAPLKAKSDAAKEALLGWVRSNVMWDQDTLGEFNPNKPAHVRWVFGQLGVSSHKRTGKGVPSYDAEALVQLKEHPSPPVAELARLILEEREPKKLLSTYIDGLPVHADGRVHPKWIPQLALTGRWASRAPNAQNIPQKMYGIFKAPGDLWWVKVDQAKFELLIVALLAGDDTILRAHAEGADLHTNNARDFFLVEKPTDAMRQAAKTLVYGMNYGAADATVLAAVQENEYIPKAVRARLGLPEIALARFNWFKAHPGIKEMHTRFIMTGIRERKAVEVIGGRECHFPGEVDITVCLNFPIQTLAGWVMNRGIVKLDTELRWDAGEAILDQVHDSVTVVGPDPLRLWRLLKAAFEQTIQHNGRSLTFKLEGKFGKGRLDNALVKFKVDEPEEAIRLRLDPLMERHIGTHEN